MKGKKYDVAVVGLQCIDLLMAPVPPDALRREGTAVQSAKMTLGGDALNQAVNLACLGARTALMGLVGNDRLGDVLLEQLAAYPMTVLDRREDVNTAISLVLAESSGAHHFIYQPQSNNTLSRRHIDDDAVGDAAILSIGGCMLLPGLDGAGLLDLLDTAHAFGTLTAVDFKINDAPPGRDELRALLRRVDYALPSLAEAEALVGRADTPAELVRRLRDLGATRCVIKLGSEGCYVTGDGFEGLVPPCPCDPVDSTGAGDCFVAAFLYALTRGWSIEKCARFANAAGAITVEHFGASGAIRDARQVLERMKEAR